MIENLSDQLQSYSYEVFSIIEKIMESKNLNFEQASKVVEIATKDMLVDAVHHLADDDIREKIADFISAQNSQLESLGNISDSICEMTIGAYDMINKGIPINVKIITCKKEDE